MFVTNYGLEEGSLMLFSFVDSTLQVYFNVVGCGLLKFDVRGCCGLDRVGLINFSSRVVRILS